MAKNNEKRVFEVSQELAKMSRLICFKYDAGIHLPEAVIKWMTQEFICLYDADEDYPTLMPDEVITLRLMLRYIQDENYLYLLSINRELSDKEREKHQYRQFWAIITAWLRQSQITI